MGISMYHQRVRLIIGVAVVLVHIFSFGMIMFFKAEWATMSQRVDLAAVLLPVTATYFMAVVKSAVDEQGDFELGKYVNLNYVTIVFLVAGSFLAAIVVIIVEVPGAFVSTIDDAKQWLIGLEVGLGGAFGYIAADLFGKVEKVSATKNRSRKADG
jgi:hypothetical protein